LYRKIKLVYGAVPPQMEFLGNIEADYLEEFLASVFRTIKHPNINPDLFGFIRIHVAFMEDYAYCKMYNTDFLLAKGYTQKQLDVAISDISTVPFDNKHQILAVHAIKAIYESKLLTQHDFNTLYQIGWSQKDVFDAIDHAGTIFRNGRILTAYTVK
ncbi:MAG TPA: hypothetical protein EYG98_04120, partial [Sulfurovum sp.]|nr:hypothetical protein [Sulfurovum sp.]